MAWTDVSGGVNAWSEVTVSQGYTLFGGMPIGLLLTLTYPVDELVGWGSTSTSTTTWTPV